MSLPIDPFYEKLFAVCLILIPISWMVAFVIPKRRKWCAWILMGTSLAPVGGVVFGVLSHSLQRWNDGISLLVLAGVQCVIGLILLFTSDRKPVPPETLVAIALTRCNPSQVIVQRRDYSQSTLCWICGKTEVTPTPIRLSAIHVWFIVAGGESVYLQVPLCPEHKNTHFILWAWVTGLSGPLLGLFFLLLMGGLADRYPSAGWIPWAGYTSFFILLGLWFKGFTWFPKQSGISLASVSQNPPHAVIKFQNAEVAGRVREEVALIESSDDQAASPSWIQARAGHL